MAIAEPLSAAPPTIARKTMPMKTCDMPSALPVPSAAPTRISLIHAASTEAPSRLPIARGRLQRGPSRAWLVAAACSLANESRMRLEHEHEIQRVGEQQHDGQADVEQRLLAHGLLGREEAAERARHAPG